MLLVASVSVELGPGDSVRLRSVTDFPVPVLLLFVVASGALFWRRRAPVAVLAIVLAAWALTLGTGISDLGWQAIVGLYSLGRYTASDRWGHAGFDAALVVLVLDGFTNSLPWNEVAFGAAVFFVVWYVGRQLRVQGERAASRLREQREQRQQAQWIVAEERARIARELHDVVAHRVSLMTVQAGAAKTVAADDPEAAVRAMGAVEVAGRQALDELRHLLEVLRPAAADDGTRPQPRLADLDRLVEQMRRAGLEVELTLDGPLTGLPAPVELSAYRIVQESLTNVVKHAGAGARTAVRVGNDGRCLSVEVNDDGQGSTVLPGSGHGLVGMRERTQLLGGSLDVGPVPTAGSGCAHCCRSPQRDNPSRGRRRPGPRPRGVQHGPQPPAGHQGRC